MEAQTPRGSRNRHADTPPQWRRNSRSGRRSTKHRRSEQARSDRKNLLRTTHHSQGGPTRRAIDEQNPASRKRRHRRRRPQFGNSFRERAHTLRHERRGAIVSEPCHARLLVLLVAVERPSGNCGGLSARLRSGETRGRAPWPRARRGSSSRELLPMMAAAFGNSWQFSADRASAEAIAAAELGRQRRAHRRVPGGLRATRSGGVWAVAVTLTVPTR